MSRENQRERKLQVDQIYQARDGFLLRDRDQKIGKIARLGKKDEVVLVDWEMLEEKEKFKYDQDVIFRPPTSSEISTVKERLQEFWTKENVDDKEQEDEEIKKLFKQKKSDKD